MRGGFDIAVIGSGFAGSITAMIARRLGLSVALIERGRHPRFAIGESSTPLANLFLEELAARYDLPRLLPFTKWGSWRSAHPEIACGLKRGFAFFRHQPGGRFSDGARRGNQLLVAASPRDAIADTHWYRPDFDQFLAREARALGAELLEETNIEDARFSAGNALLRVRRKGRILEINARLLIDASGPRGFLHRALGLPEKRLPAMPPTQGLFTHFADVPRWDSLFPAAGTPPFPIDDAAVHHVFDGGWIWVLRFSNGVTSAGAAVTSALARELRLGDGGPAWDRLLARLPSVAEQFAGARPLLPFTHSPRLSFLSGRVAGPGWVLLPSAGGVVDPLLSTGIPLALRGILRLGRVLENDWAGEAMPAALEEYARETTGELRQTARLVGALYANMGDFTLFKRLALLYFAAASYSETALRLNRPELAPGFLLGGHAEFAPRARRCLERAVTPLTVSGRAALLREIGRAIAPVDIAGLGDRKRRDWHPVRAEDLFAAAGKLEATPGDIRAMLERSGFSD